MKSNIALIGMRGTGKTTIGKELAKKLNKEFIDTDYKIEEKMNMTIPEIVEKYGWDYFRKVEKLCVCEASEQTNTIISTGGGIVLDIENITYLTRSSIIVLINTSVDIIYKRIKNSDRPPLTSKPLKKELIETWTNRESKYKDASNITYDKENIDITEEDADNIIKLIENYDSPKHS